MTTAATLIGRARVTLIDSAKVTFTDDELLAYLNEGIAHACGVLLDIYVKAEVATLAAGFGRTFRPAACCCWTSPATAQARP